MRKLLLTAAIVLVATMTVGFGSVASADTAAGTTVKRVPTAETVIFITIDDRLTPRYARPILATLKKYNATATWFVPGQSLEDFPGLAREIVAAGHRIAAHGYSHVYLNGKSRAYVLKQLTNTDAAAQRAGLPALAPLFRAPGGTNGKVMLGALKTKGYANILWTIPVSMRPGAILLYHGTRPATVATLGRTLARAQAAGYRVGDLYSYLYPHRYAEEQAALLPPPALP